MGRDRGCGSCGGAGRRHGLRGASYQKKPFARGREEVGVRGAVGLGSGKWAIPYYLDVGTDSSTFTWQGVAGIEYRFSWVDLQLMYRYLYYDMKGDKML